MTDKEKNALAFAAVLLIVVRIPDFSFNLFFTSCGELY